MLYLCTVLTSNEHILLSMPFAVALEEQSTHQAVLKFFPTLFKEILNSTEETRCYGKNYFSFLLAAYNIFKYIVYPLSVFSLLTLFSALFLCSELLKSLV